MTLKPKYLAGLSDGVHLESFDKLDIDMLIKCLHQGEYKNTTYCLNVLREGSYNKSSYEFLPKAFKYKISEYAFNNRIFIYDCFYDYNTDPTQIKIDYCEYILKLVPSARRPLKLYNKLKLSQPEYFV